MKVLKVIFMGTPEFSCPTLQKLIDDSEIEIVAVYTKEPKIAGRGQKIVNSPIHNLAIANNLPVVTPKTLKNQEEQEKFANFKADFAVVVAYGLILPTPILQAPKFGCINIHPSLLPKWRGAAPIHRTLMNGDNQTAITIIKMDEGLDSGDMICQKIINLDPEITYPELANLFSNNGADILLKTLKNIKSGNFKLTKQDDNLTTYANKIEKSETLIDWNQPATEINNKIRALSGNLGAYFIHQNKRLKIHKAIVIDQDLKNKEIGKITINNQKMSISCHKGHILPLILQKEGKKPVKIEEFLRGLKH